MGNEITPVTVHLQTPTRRSHSFDMWKQKSDDQTPCFSLPFVN
jgi:hypothetical protein